MNNQEIEDQINYLRAVMTCLSPAETITKEAKALALEVRRLEALLKPSTNLYTSS